MTEQRPASYLTRSAFLCRRRREYTNLAAQAEGATLESGDVSASLLFSSFLLANDGQPPPQRAEMIGFPSRRHDDAIGFRFGR